MALIELTQGQVAIVDDEILEYLLEKKWYADWKKRSIGRVFYAVNKSRNAPRIAMHRYVMEYYGHDIANLMVDHINGNTLDNRYVNLRVCTNQQNQQNRKMKHLGSHSKYKGVSKKYKKWAASITISGKKIHIGMYFTEEDAARAYDKKAIELFKEYASLNFPEEYQC